MTELYRARRTLPLRVEFIRQIRRRRTLVSYLLMLLLPIIVVAAVKFGPSASSSSSSGTGGGRFGSGSLNLIGLATSGAANFTIVMLFFGTGFLLTTVFALFTGDTVASEASWSTLRYLLAAPVPRRRLLLVKLIVGLVLNAGALLFLVVSSYLIGWAAFGAGPLISPTGGSFEGAEMVWRIAVVTMYVFISLLFVCGIAFLMSVRTDAPLGAVGTAVMVSIVFTILDALEALGDIRLWLPGHYSDSWTDALSVEIVWDSMARGTAQTIVLFSLLIAWAFLKFDRKDILS